MKIINRVLIFEQYTKYATYGAACLLAAWLIALLTTAILPGPYRFEFFGVMAETTATESTVTVGGAAFATAFIFLPVIMMAVDHFKSRFNK